VPPLGSSIPSLLLQAALKPSAKIIDAPSRKDPDRNMKHLRRLEKARYAASSPRGRYTTVSGF
jgi:hypothetical protein